MIPFTWAEASEIKSSLDGLDQLAITLERRWGVGRLELLVSDDLRTRFRRQRDKLNNAIAQNDPAQILKHAAAMRLAWAALNKAATASGEQPLTPAIWEVALDNHTVAALVQSNPEAVEIIRTGRYIEVWTAAEIANLINHFRNKPALPPNPYQTLAGNKIAYDLDDPLNDPLPF